MERGSEIEQTSWRQTPGWVTPLLWLEGGAPGASSPRTQPFVRVCRAGRLQAHTNAVADHRGRTRGDGTIACVCQARRL